LNESLQRAKKNVSETATKYEKKLLNLGDKWDKKIDSSGIKAKIGNFFSKKNKKDNNKN
jgi:hypothetical protein